MEHLKLLLTYLFVGVIFDIPLYIKCKKINEFSGLRFRIKQQIGVIVGISAGSFAINLLKIDSNIFDFAKDLLSAIMINIVLLFFKKYK